MFSLKLGPLNIDKFTGLKTRMYLFTRKVKIPWARILLGGPRRTFVLYTHYPGDPWWRVLNIEFSYGDYSYHNFTRKLRRKTSVKVVDFEEI